VDVLIGLTYLAFTVIWQFWILTWQRCIVSILEEILFFLEKYSVGQSWSIASHCQLRRLTQDSETA
jgi:hypothetical protein